jgi:hypothetical protein
MAKELKREVFMSCTVQVSRGILPIGSFKAVAQDFDIDAKTVAKLWSMTTNQVNGYQPNTPIDPPFIISNLPTTAFDTKFENAGRKPKLDMDTVFQQIENVDKESRKSLNFFAGAIGVSKTSIIRMKKAKQIKAYTMSLKPKWNDDHRSKRFYHCLSKIDRNTLTGANGLKYKTFYNEVHVNEKWFYYLVQDHGRYYLTTNEAPPPTKTVQHKSHITKVMFFCALARPRYNNNTRQWFDGLIAIYPVGEFDIYQHSSANHERGDLKWTNISLDREEYQEMMIKLVLPDIKRKMPINNNIIVQHDGATKAHLTLTLILFMALRIHRTVVFGRIKLVA